MENLLELAWSALKSAVPPTFLVLAIGWFCRTWISERLKASVKHEYDDRLEQLRAELQSQGNTNLALLKSEIDRQADKLRIASSSFTEVQKATIPKRIEAIELLWLAVLESRRLMPSAIVTTDVLTKSELLGVYSGPLGAELREVEFGIVSKFFAGIEGHRPFLGEVIWAQYAGLHGILARIIYLFREGRRAPEKLIWYEDDNIRRMIRALLGDSLAEQFKALSHSRIQWLNGQFDRQLLRTLEQLLSGQEFGEAALRHAESTLNTVLKATLSPEFSKQL